MKLKASKELTMTRNYLVASLDAIDSLPTHESVHKRNKRNPTSYSALATQTYLDDIRALDELCKKER